MEILEQFGINGKLLVVQIINFTVLLFVLKKLLYKPLIKILDKRRAAVAESMETAEKMKKEQEELEEKVAAELKKAKAEAAGIVSKADDAANQLTATKTAEARAQAEKIVEDARTAVAQEKADILDSVRDEVVGLVVAGTEKLLDKKVSGDEAFVKDTLAKIKK